MPANSDKATSNPFATRCVRPGALAYHFAPQQSARQVTQKLQDLGWWGEIIGPHGSGKSTLVRTLIASLEAGGRRVVLFTLRRGATSDRIPRRPMPTWDGQTQVIVDGFEQLGWWQRRRLKHACRRRGAGLLVTAHQSVGLPPLLRTEATLETARWIVSRLVATATELIGDEDIVRCFARHEGNLREMLFDLYDLYEQRRAVDTWPDADL